MVAFNMKHWAVDNSGAGTGGSFLTGIINGPTINTIRSFSYRASATYKSEVLAPGYFRDLLDMKYPLANGDKVTCTCSDGTLIGAFGLSLSIIDLYLIAPYVAPAPPAPPAP